MYRKQPSKNLLNLTINVDCTKVADDDDNNIIPGDEGNELPDDF